MILEEKRQQTIVNSKKRNRRKKRSTQAPKGSPVFTQCAMDYYKCLVDPWSYRYAESLPCIPDLIAVPSYKFNTTVIGTCFVGAAGFGFIAINPHILGSGRGIGWFSQATYPGLVIDQTAGTGKTVFYDPTFPYDGIAEQPSFRLVACGLRIKYTGQELTRGGQIALGSNDSVSNNYNGYSFSQVASQPDTVPQSVTRGWRGCIYKPVRQDSFDYFTAWDHFGSEIEPKMCCVFTGNAGNEYSFEIVRFWEGVSDGSTTVPQVSASHSDITGVSKIRDFLASTAQSEFGQSMLSKGLEYFKNQAVSKGPLLLTYL